MFLRQDDTPHREIFSSFQGVSMPLGTYKNRASTKQDFKENFLKTTGISTNAQAEPIKDGLHHTKFGKGFSRRNEANIKNTLAEQERKDIIEYQQKKAGINERLNEHRRDNLKSIDNYNGYNIITNNIRNEAFRPESNPHHQQLVKPTNTGIRYIPTEGLGDESRQRGQHMLRDSNARFYTPVPSGHRQNYRQDMLYREGLASSQRYIGVLEPGKKDLISYGVEDQFSKNEYYKPKMEAPPQDMSYGLYEKRLPGQFTPRQIPNHPSANSNAVNNWTTKVDIFNNTTREYVSQGNHHRR